VATPIHAGQTLPLNATISNNDPSRSQSYDQGRDSPGFPVTNNVEVAPAYTVGELIKKLGEKVSRKDVIDLTEHIYQVARTTASFSTA